MKARTPCADVSISLKLRFMDERVQSYFEIAYRALGLLGTDFNEEWPLTWDAAYDPGLDSLKKRSKGKYETVIAVVRRFSIAPMMESEHSR